MPTAEKTAKRPRLVRKEMPCHVCTHPPDWLINQKNRTISHIPSLFWLFFVKDLIACYLFC